MSAKVETAGHSVSIRSLLGPLMAVIIGMIMVILDSTVVNVAIPGLQADFKSLWGYKAYSFVPCIR